MAFLKDSVKAYKMVGWKEDGMVEMLVHERVAWKDGWKAHSLAASKGFYSDHEMAAKRAGMSGKWMVENWVVKMAAV